jgi:hypothetical protein
VEATWYALRSFRTEMKSKQWPETSRDDTAGARFEIESTAVADQ